MWLCECIWMEIYECYDSLNKQVAVLCVIFVRLCKGPQQSQRRQFCDHTYPPDTLSGYQSYCQNSVISHITIGSYVSVRAESNSSFLSALQTSQVLHISMYAQLTYEPIVLKHFQPEGKFFSRGKTFGWQRPRLMSMAKLLKNFA